MAGLDSDVDVLLYGATGYTGELIARELDARGASYALAGRNEERLAALAGSLAGRPDFAVVPLDDPDGLARLARRARVLCSAAGPYVQMGPPLVDAARAAGAHFLDVTGEQAFLRWAFDQDAAFKDADLTMVNAMGFDVVPSDIAALVSTTAMASVERVELCIWTTSGMSQGTRRSMAATAGKGWVYADGRFKRAAPGRYWRSFRFPDAAEKAAIFVPWGDVVTAPRTTGARNVRTFFVGKESTVRRFHRMWPVTSALERTPILRRSLAKKAEGTRNPTPEKRAASRFSILAEAEDADGTVQRGLVTGKDPYGFTGAAAAHGAMMLAKNPFPRGVLTPTQAFTFGPFAEAMRPFELEWRARSLN